MASKLGELGNDILLAIFLYLTGRDIYACQLVCRRLNDFVRSSLVLRFVANLSLSGYVESCNSRTDIALTEKFDALRLRLARRRNHAISSMDIIHMGTANGGFPSWHLPSPTSTHPPLKDGVLTQWSLISPDSRTDLQLDVVQLPSLNTGTGLKQWRMTQRGLNIKSYAVEPRCDLLLLLEYTGPLLHNFDARPPVQAGVDGLGGGIPQPYLFHFRTLSTNGPHPNAFQPVLDCGLRTQSAHGFKIECFGDLIVARPGHNTAQPQESGLLIYNWVTGALLDRRAESYPHSLVVLTNNIIAMTRTTFAYNSQDRPMGRLDLYLIDWSDFSSPNLSFVAILQLPIVHSVPPPPSLPGRIFRLDQPQQAITPEPDLSLAAMTCLCSFSSGSESGHPTAYKSGLSRIFASDPSNQLLRIHIQLPPTENSLEFGGLGHGPTPRDTSLYVPLQVVFDVVESSPAEGSPRRIQWEQWGPRARWIHLKSDFWESPLRAPAGTRCVLTRHSAPHEAIIRFDPNEKHEFELLLLDFNPDFAKRVEHATNKRGLGDEDDAKWNYQPATNNHMSPVTPHIDQRRSWLAESGASKAAIPYVWSRLKHPYFEDVVAQLQNWTVMMDNEHIVVVEGAPATNHMVKIVAFTF
ncbi:hypothetical protein FRC12_000713 [Ceratobasidium sp. 428]|nr:hypothetical protein FRC12_000713 [Ceratobasidium sp. 428]